MKKIKQIVEQIEQIKSDKALDIFFRSIRSIGAYKWSGLILFIPETASSTTMKSVGNIPSKVLMKLQQQRKELFAANDGESIQFIAKDTQPSWQLESDLQGVLLIKFNTESSEFGYLVLGVLQQSQRALSDMIEGIGWFWLIIIPYIYQAYRRNTVDAKPKLTKREIECMRWVSEGKTSWEISQILNISERTANFHIANYIEKTGSINRQQAITKCLLQGHLMSA